MCYLEVSCLISRVSEEYHLSFHHRFPRNSVVVRKDALYGFRPSKFSEVCFVDQHVACLGDYPM